MAYPSQFTLMPNLLSQVDAIAGLRERIVGAAVELTWIPALETGRVEKADGKKTGHALRKP